MSRSLTAILLALALLTPLQAVAEEAAREAFATDAQGRSLRVDFPPHDRLWLQGGVLMGDATQPTLSLGWNTTLGLDFPDEEIWWQLRHRIGVMEMRPGSPTTYVLGLVEADYLRHDMASTILIPRRKRDIRLPANFDVAVIWTLARATLDSTSEETSLRRFEVARLGVLMDFIRDERYLHRFAVGLEASHRADRPNAGGLVHTILPFSGITAIWGWEHPRGLFAISLRPTFGRVATIASTTPTWSWFACGDAEVEWTPLAINDAPLSLVGTARVETLVGESTDWSSTLALRLSLPTRESH